MNKIQIVFDGPPGHDAGRFVEVERDGKSIHFGEWKQREDGYWALEFPYPAPPESGVRVTDSDIDKWLDGPMKMLTRNCATCEDSGFCFGEVKDAIKVGLRSLGVKVEE